MLSYMHGNNIQAILTKSFTKQVIRLSFYFPTRFKKNFFPRI